MAFYQNSLSSVRDPLPLLTRVFLVAPPVAQPSHAKIRHASRRAPVAPPNQWEKSSPAAVRILLLSVNPVERPSAQPSQDPIALSSLWGKSSPAAARVLLHSTNTVAAPSTQPRQDISRPRRSAQPVRHIFPCSCLCPSLLNESHCASRRASRRTLVTYGVFPDSSSSKIS